MEIREELGKLYNKRIKVKAKVGRYGQKSAYKGGRKRTILFENVKHAKTGKILTDHIWFTVGKRIKERELIPGDRVSFHARVRGYTKGYRKDQFDYKLAYPTKFKVLEKGKIPIEEIKKEIKEQEKLRKKQKKEKLRNICKKADFSYKTIDLTNQKKKEKSQSTLKDFLN